MLYRTIHVSCLNIPHSVRYHLFFFNDTATTEIYTLSLHDALPISFELGINRSQTLDALHHSSHIRSRVSSNATGDRKSTRLNSSHLVISYAVFCLKKKKTARASHKDLGTISCSELCNLKDRDACLD